MEFELIEVPAGSTTEHGPLTIYQRFPLDEAFAVSRTGTVRLPELPQGTAWRLVLERGVPRFIGEAGARLRSLTDSIFEATMGPLRLRFRVVPSETPRLAWSGDLDALIARVTPGSAGLDVLADVLLEQRHPLGERLRGLPTGFSDDLWQGDLPLFEADGVLDLKWSRGVVTEAIVRSSEAIERLPAHVLGHLVQSLELVLWEDGSNEAAHRAIDRLAERGLPWLSRLTLHGTSAGGELSRSWRRRRWRDRFPENCELVARSDSPGVLRASSGQHPIPREGTLTLPAGFVRHRGQVPVLTVNHETLMLNGVVRRRPSPQRPWLIPLRRGDLFTLESTEYALTDA